MTVNDHIQKARLQCILGHVDDVARFFADSIKSKKINLWIAVNLKEVLIKQLTFKRFD